MATNNYPNIGYRTIGKQRDFFTKVTVTSSSWGGNSVSGQQPDVIINLSGTTQGILLLNEDATNVVEVSFDGLVQADELAPGTPSAGIAYDNRVVSTIWLRLKSGFTGSAVVSIRAWSQY